MLIVKQTSIKEGCCHSSVDSSAPTILGSSSKHAIYAFSFIVFVLYLSCEKDENKQKEAGFGPFKKTSIKEAKNKPERT